jgi:exodeoxyribonuclease-3
VPTPTIYPETLIPYPSPVKICTYNILEGGTGRIDPLAEVLRLAAADVVIIQEAWDASLFHKLADRLGMDRFLAENPANPHGSTGLLSRRPIRTAVNHAPLDKRLTRSAFHAVVEGGSDLPWLPLVGLHLHARETFADEAVRLAELPAIFDIAAALPGPHLLAGDFNTSHPDQVIDIAKLRPSSRQRIAGQNSELPRDVIRHVLARGYVDAHTLHRTPSAFDTTLTTAYPAMRVDFLFVTAGLASRLKSCDVFKPEMARFASDHFPVVAELDL